MEEIKLVVCDVDGTLLNTEKEVTQMTLNAIQRLKDAGYLFGLASGRPILSLEKHLKTWQLEDCIDIMIGLNGVEIKDLQSKEKQMSHRLPKEAVREIVEFYRDLDVNFVFYLDKTLGACKDEPLSRSIAEVDGLCWEHVDLDEMCNQSTGKIMIVAQEDVLEKAVSRSTGLINPLIKSCQTSCHELEYFDAHISKFEGLNLFCEQADISTDAVLAFGDADNDFEMILHCGVGVAMGNATERVKSISDYVTLDNDHDGVGIFLNRYLLSGYEPSNL